MNKILTIEQAIKLSKKLREEERKIVLVGGCFDILHIGHISFLQKAKQGADMLFLLLESDQAVTKTKGKNRPINTQQDRALILESLLNVDCIVLLPKDFTNNDYDNMILQLKPDIIATTKGDPNRQHKERQAKITGAQIVDVIQKIPNKSTSRLAKILTEKYIL